MDCNNRVANIGIADCQKPIVNQKEIKLVVRKQWFPEIFDMEPQLTVAHIKAALEAKTVVIVRLEGMPNLVPYDIAKTMMEDDSTKYRPSFSFAMEASEKLKQALQDLAETNKKFINQRQIVETRNAVHPKFAAKYQPVVNPRNTNKPTKKKKRR